MDIPNNMVQNGILMNQNHFKWGLKISEQGSKLSDMTGITTQTTNEVGGARPGVLKNGKFKRTSLKNIQMLPQYVSHERR